MKYNKKDSVINNAKKANILQYKKSQHYEI